MAEAFGIACHQLMSFDFRFGSTIGFREEKAVVVAQWVCERTRGSELSTYPPRWRRFSLHCRWRVRWLAANLTPTGVWLFGSVVRFAGLTHV